MEPRVLHDPEVESIVRSIEEVRRRIKASYTAVCENNEMSELRLRVCGRIRYEKSGGNELSQM